MMVVFRYPVLFVDNEFNGCLSSVALFVVPISYADELIAVLLKIFFVTLVDYLGPGFSVALTSMFRSVICLLWFVL
ncbi:MAG: hypothetical protein ACC650_02780 [Gammaproteobacteria bacterium]